MVFIGDSSAAAGLVLGSSSQTLPAAFIPLEFLLFPFVFPPLIRQPFSESFLDENPFLRRHSETKGFLVYIRSFGVIV